MHSGDEIHQSDAAGALIVGRQPELRRVHERYVRALQGNGGLALVGGVAGIGKTALVNHFLNEASEQAPVVLIGHCTDLQVTPAYGPWVDLIRRYRASADLPDVPDVLRRGTGMGEIGSQIELFDVALDFLTEIAAVRPVVIVLEDLHWSDVESLSLLRYIARATSDHRVLLIATYRNDEIPADHPLYGMLPALIRESGAERIDLRPIDESATSELLVHYYTLSEQDRQRLISYLDNHAEGNPLYLLEILRVLENDDKLRQHDGSWSLGDLDTFRIPEMLAQLLEQRIKRLGPEHRGMLEIAAITGDEVDIDLWQRVSEASDDELDEVVDEALRTNILREGLTGNALVFSHVLIRQIFYQQTSRIRRRRIHLRIAEALIEQQPTSEDTIAHHLQQAGDQRAVDWLVRAADRALQTYAIPSAGERFARAGALLKGNEERSNERGWLLYRAARQLRFTDLERGMEYMSEAELIGRREGDDVLTAYSIADRGHLGYLMGNGWRGLNDLRTGTDLINNLPAEHIQDDDLRNWVADIVLSRAELEREDQGFLQELGHFNPRLSSLCLFLAGAGYLHEARSKGEWLRDQLAAVQNPDHHILSPYADVSNALAIAYSHLGRPAEAKESNQIAHDTMKRINHLAFIGATINGRLDYVILPFETDNLEERRQLESMAHTAAMESHRAMLTETPEEVTNFWLLYIEGRWAEAWENAERLSTLTLRGVLRRIRLALGQIARDIGDAALAQSYLDLIIPNGPRVQPLETDLASVLDGASLGLSLAIDAGDLSRAREWLECHEWWIEWSGAEHERAGLSLGWSLFHEHSGDDRQANEAAEAGLAYATSPRQPLMLMRIQRQLGKLALNRHDLEIADAHLRESLALSEACAAPFEVALTRLQLARLMFAQKDIGAAENLLGLVRDEAGRLDAAPLLEQVNALSGASPIHQPEPAVNITNRERDVLSLVAQGLGDPEIAERLFVSRRTVNTHLTSIYRKLDVSNRTSAAIRARELNLIKTQPDQ